MQTRKDNQSFIEKAWLRRVYFPKIDLNTNSVLLLFPWSLAIMRPNILHRYVNIDTHIMQFSFVYHEFADFVHVFIVRYADNFIGKIC